MIKIIKESKKDVIIKLNDLKTMQIGIIVTECELQDHYIIRTLENDIYSFLDLTDQNKNIELNNFLINIDVRLLDPDEKVIIELSND